jgi:hypothetical protein
MQPMNSPDKNQHSNDSGDTQSQLDDLVDTWQLAADDGVPVSIESLCEDCPELLEPLRLRIEQIK